MQAVVERGLVFVAVLSAIGCYIRPDYNVPVLLFSGLLWNLKVLSSPMQPHVRPTLLHVILWTWVFDVVWLLLHAVLWSRESNQQVDTRLHSLTLLLGSSVFLLKLALIVLTLVTDPQARESMRPSAIASQIKKQFTGRN